MVELTEIQSEVLKELRDHPSRRFTDIMMVTKLSSDNFKFHLRKFIKLGLVEKTQDGLYSLTNKGKAYANRFDYDNLAPRKQSKLTAVTFVYRETADPEVREYLFHQRKRQPFYGYWGVIDTHIRAGELYSDAARRGLKEQAGLLLQPVLKGFFRQQDTDHGAGEILEDRLFVVYEAEWDGQSSQDWEYANSSWMTAALFQEKNKKFDSCLSMLRKLDENEFWFAENITRYYPGEF